MNQAREADAIEPGTGRSPWPDHEHVFGQAHMAITDPEEYRRTRERVVGRSGTGVEGAR